MANPSKIQQCIGHRALSYVTLWPKVVTLRERTVRFAPGKVNYVWSSTRTGKSCLWPIVDYALGARRLCLPQGPVPMLTGWVSIGMTTGACAETFARALRESNGQIFLRSDVATVSLHPDATVGWTRHQQSLGTTFLDLPPTPFGRVSSRDLVLLNHLPQYSLGNPHSFVESSTKSFSRLKIGYLMQSLFGKSDADASLYIRYIKRKRGRMSATRHFLQVLTDELVSLSRLAAERGAMPVPLESLRALQFEVLHRELTKAIRGQGLRTRLAY